MKHKWIKVEKDLRRYVDEPRPMLHQCEHCKLYRMTFNFSTGWRTFYGKPYGDNKIRAPECKE